MGDTASGAPVLSYHADFLRSRHAMQEARSVQDRCLCRNSVVEYILYSTPRGVLTVHLR